MKRILVAVCLLLAFVASVSFGTDYPKILFENAAVFLTDGENKLEINANGSIPTDATIADGSNNYNPPIVAKGLENEANTHYRTRHNCNGG